MNDIKNIREELDAVSLSSCDINRGPFPKVKDVRMITVDLLSVLFPGFFFEQKDASLDSIRERLGEQIRRVMNFSDVDGEFTSVDAVDDFFHRLPEVKRLLLTDIEAIYEGDPAAKSREEVMLCYPGLMAIAIQRMAHVLYELKVPIIPRMMTEFAHSRTGADIHAGAQIGEYFCIDHVTGIVVGETTVIGDHVKMYQGVTLGAKSFKTDESGNPVKNIKRHPNIGNNVVIYTNATILGGRTFIGDNSIIGANTWIVQSVPPDSTVYYSPNVASAEQFWGDNGSGI